MDNIVRGLEEIELTEAELEVIYGAGMEGMDGFQSCHGFSSCEVFHPGTVHVNIDGTSFFTATCYDQFFIHTTISTM